MYEVWMGIRGESMMQGVLLDCSALLPYPMEAFPAAASQGPETFARPPLWLALDEVQDPVRPSALTPSVCVALHPSSPSLLGSLTPGLNCCSSFLQQGPLANS